MMTKKTAINLLSNNFPDCYVTNLKGMPIPFVLHPLSVQWGYPIPYNEV